MANIHIISDLNLEYHEHTNPEDEVIPDGCDLVVINGNIGRNIKRSMLFAETLCNKYPNVPVIYNLGLYEGGFHTKTLGKTNNIDAVLARQGYSPHWPKNLYFPHLSPINIYIGEEKYDIMCAFGFPKIISADNWEESFWYRYISFGTTTDHSLFRPKGAADVYHGPYPKKVTVEEINEHHNREQAIIRDWELNYSDDSGYKILITALSPLNDPLCAGLKYIMYPNFHLNNRLWITSGVKFSGSIVRGAKLVSNPGAGAQRRQQLVSV